LIVLCAFKIQVRKDLASFDRRGKVSEVLTGLGREGRPGSDKSEKGHLTIQ
jgi:hypothetical protein